MAMLEALKAKQPDRNLVFTAIDELTEPGEIRLFYEEYRVLVGEEIASQNVGYILGYYGTETMYRWFDALPTISHPIFGRRTDVSAEEAFAKGLELGEVLRKWGGTNAG